MLSNYCIPFNLFPIPLRTRIISSFPCTVAERVITRHSIQAITCFDIYRTRYSLSAEAVHPVSAYASSSFGDFVTHRLVLLSLIAFVFLQLLYVLAPMIYSLYTKVHLPRFTRTTHDQGTEPLLQ